MQAVILAGGKGTRLAPYTMVFPKPMLPVGGLPIIETIIRQLSYYGFNDIIISLGYLGDMIQLYFKDKSKIPANTTIRYVYENEPLGTAGAIALIDDLDENFLALNGDILTTLDFRQFYDFHIEKDATLSIAVGVKKVQMNLGIVEMNGENRIVGFNEKPTYEFHDNMGIYIYNKRSLVHIERNKRLDLNILVDKMMASNDRVYGYRSDVPYFWIDIGQHADFEKANSEFEKNKHDFLKSENI